VSILLILIYFSEIFCGDPNHIRPHNQIFGLLEPHGISAYVQNLLFGHTHTHTHTPDRLIYLDH